MMKGFFRETSFAFPIKVRPSFTPSRYDKITSVAESSAKASKKSAVCRSASFPLLMMRLKPTPKAYAAVMNEVARFPLWETTPTGPAGGNWGGIWA